MTAYHFTLLPEFTDTRRLLRAVRYAVFHTIEKWNLTDDDLNPLVSGDVERHRTKHDTRYVFGIGTSTRSTLIGHYVVGSGEIMLCLPNGYTSWYRANTYDRLRVAIRDCLVHGLHGGTQVIDPTVPARDWQNLPIR